MSPFLGDMGLVTLGAATVTTAIVAMTRLCWRRGKGLEEL